MQENAICFISKCIVYHLFLHQTAGYTETLCVCCDVAQLEQTRWEKFALFWCKSAPFERVPSHNSFHSSPENLEWHHLLTKSCQHFFFYFFYFCIEQHLTILVTSHWNHVAEAESEALAHNIGHVFVHNPQELIPNSWRMTVKIL